MPERYLLAKTGVTAHPDTFAKALKLAGITRIKQRAKGSFVSPEPRKSYGYNETHRRQLPEQRYPSCLTDAEWDSQSTRSSPQGGASGFDAGKKVKGRKRSLIVDTLGLLLAVSISAASVQDRDAADDAVAYSKEKYPSLTTLFVDSAYAGKWAQCMHQMHAVNVQLIRGSNNRRTGQWHSEQGDLFTVAPAPTGFVVMPNRWVVERTHAWNERARRLIMHHDRLLAVSEAWVWLAEARILARRLTT
nr:transposase [Pseudomonas capeferrum]